MKATAMTMLDAFKDRCRVQLEDGIRLMTKYGALTPYEYTDPETGERKTEMVASGYCAVFKMGIIYDGCDPEPLYNDASGRWERATNMDDAWSLAKSADLLLYKAKQANPRTKTT